VSYIIYNNVTDCIVCIVSQELLYFFARRYVSTTIPTSAPSAGVMAPSALEASDFDRRLKALEAAHAAVS